MIYKIKDLLTDFQNNRQEILSDKINFAGVEGKDVYNITAPFEDKGELVIAGRVEGRDTEFSDVVFFVEENNVWKPRPNTKTYALQDPFVSKINGELIFGGVEVFPLLNKEGHLGWRTVFYKGSEINNLEKFAVGPDGMKDIRLLQLPKGNIGIFTRPQGEKGGRGKIGYTEISSLAMLTKEVIDNTPLIEEHFLSEEWGGVNEAYLLKNDAIGVLAHIARFDELGNRHYYPIIFIYDKELNRITNMEIIATRNDFNDGPAKRSDIIDVLFSGGLKRLGNGKAELYVGVSDAEAHKAIISDPFVKYELKGEK